MQDKDGERHDEQPASDGSADSAEGQSETPQQIEAAPTDFRRHIWLLIVVVGVVLVAWLAETLTGDEQQRPRAVSDAGKTEPNDLRSQIPLLGQRDTPPLCFAPAAETDFLTRRDRVVVLTLGGQVRAYPVRLLQMHAAVRDTMAEKQILVCWSLATQLARCFVLGPDDQGLQFVNSGRVYRGNVVFYDTKTESLWDSFSGRVLAGPRTGDALQRVPAVVHPWLEWREANPDAPVLALESGLEDLRKKGFYGDDAIRTVAAYLSVPDLPFAVPGYKAKSSPLPAKAFVLGLEVGSRHRAYPLQALLAAGQRTLKDQLDGRSVVINVSSPWTAYARSADGKVLDASLMLWFAWKWVHPDTEVWSPDRP